MSKGPEHRLYDWLRHRLPPSWHMTRIETSTANGIPDINLIIDGFEAWLECNDGEEAILRKEQWAWMQRRAACGGLCLVVLQRSKGWQLFKVRAKLPHTIMAAGIRLDQVLYEGMSAAELTNKLQSCTLK